MPEQIFPVKKLYDGTFELDPDVIVDSESIDWDVDYSSAKEIDGRLHMPGGHLRKVKLLHVVVDRLEGFFVRASEVK